jgi:hypothetical protein
MDLCLYINTGTQMEKRPVPKATMLANIYTQSHEDPDFLPLPYILYTLENYAPLSQPGIQYFYNMAVSYKS